MIDDSLTMVVAIVLIVTIGKVLSSRYKAKAGIVEDVDMLGNVTQRQIETGDAQRMQDEIRTLKDRIQVLERIATDNSSANDVSRQIEALREKS
jgi:mRNA-degrading endonuclease toxin of MazEF toxin-antitoxin module